MFSNRIGRLDELAPYLAPQAIEILRDMFGQTNARLRHAGPIIMAAPSGGDFGDNELAEGSDFVMKGRGLGTAKWGRATKASEVRTNVRTGKQAVWVEVQERDNQYGEYKAGNEAAGVCDKWFCNTSTGKRFDVMLSPPGSDGTPRSGANSGAISAVAGDMIPFAYDRHATAVALGVGLGVNQTRMRYAQAIGGWEWMPGFAGMVGKVQAVQVVDVFGADAGTTVNIYYLRVSAGQDPNVQPGQLFGWSEDEAGNRVAISSYLDAKIGSIKELKPGVSLPGGWADYTAAIGYFPVGFGRNDPEYNPAGATGGRHPIRPRKHKQWRPGMDPRDDARLYIADHNQRDIEITISGEIAIGPTSLTTQTVCLGGSSSEISYTELAEATVETATANIEIDEHDNHRHAFDVAGSDKVDAGQDGTEAAVDATPSSEVWTSGVDVISGSQVHLLDHIITQDSHGHDPGPPHRHEIKYDEDDGLITCHAHAVYPSDHTHPAALDLTAMIDKTDALKHIGYASHAIEDYRPPWRAARYIIRVGPDGD